MKSRISTVGASLLAACTAIGLPTPVAKAEPRVPSTAAPKALAGVLESLRAGESLDSERQLEIYRETIGRLRREHPNLVRFREDQNSTGEHERASEVRESLWELALDLSFEPTMEAKLPEGFPAPSTVGEIALKEYPAYRRAVVGGASENQSFFALFSHIKLSGISMTAPVELRGMRGLDPPQEDGEPRKGTMAFLYGSPKTGETGKSPIPGVEVGDEPKATVVSVAIRGEPSAEQLADLESRLRDWVEENRPEAVDRLGTARLLAYNSPSVPRKERYFELQIPILAEPAP